MAHTAAVGATTLELEDAQLGTAQMLEDLDGDLVRELRRLGATVTERQDGLTLTPASLHGETVATYDDHRMAMSLALAGLRVPGVRVADPACVGKTFPEYWDRLAALVGR